MTPYALKITNYISVPVHRVVAAKPPGDGPPLFGRSLEDILDVQYGRVTWAIWLRIDGFDSGPLTCEWFAVEQPHARAWWDLMFPPAEPPSGFPWPGQPACSMGWSGMADRCTTHPGGTCAPPPRQAPQVHPPGAPPREPPPTE